MEPHNQPRTRRSFKALGLLLSYPDEHLLDCLQPAIEVLLQEQLVSGSAVSRLEELCTTLAQERLSELQELYVNVFDRTRSLSLHLFEHLHGDSRDRGQAMVDLRERYAAAGFSLTAKELPDYLPAFCEFLSLIDEDVARGLLSDAAPLLSGLHQRLEKRHAAYASVLAALLELTPALTDAPPTPASDELEKSEISVVPRSMAELDAEWEDAPITFGVGAAHDSCKTPAGAGDSPLIQLRKPNPKPNSGETYGRR